MPEGEVMRALIDGKIPRPSERRTVDPKLEEIVMKALAPDANSRYPSALALRNAIDEYLGETSPKTSTREVGELASNIFAEQQESRKQQIQQALQAPFSEPPLPVPQGLEAILQTPVSAALETSLQGRKRQMLWIGIAASLAAVIVILATVAYLGGQHGRSEPAAPEMTAPSKVQIRLSVAPAAAVLSVDGNPLASNPALLTVPPDDKDHEIRATLEGHEAYKKTVRFQGDLTLDIELQPHPPAAAPSASQLSASIASINLPKKSRVSAKQIGTTKANCNPPFYFENGFKTYKPGCL